MMWVTRILIVMLLAAAPTAFSAPLYHFTDLGDLPGGLDDSSAFAINNYGQVAGRGSSSISNTRAFLWTPTAPNRTSGSMIDLGSLNDQVAAAWGINGRGEITGFTSAPGGAVAMLRTPTAPNAVAGTMSAITGLAQGQAINVLGQVAGRSGVAGGGQHAMLWTPDVPNSGGSGTIVDLGDLPGGEDRSSATGMNDYGQVVGSSSIDSYEDEVDASAAFLWTPSTPNGQAGTMVPFTNFSGANVVSSSAWGINASGQVALTGMLDFIASPTRAFRWTPATPNGTSGVAIDLGTLPYREDSAASDINAAGDVVGTSGSSPFVWTESDGMLELAEHVAGGLPTGVRLHQARAINDMGQITGVAAVGTAWRAYLLTPVPEPASSAAVVCTSAVAVLARRRRTATAVLSRR